MAPHPLEACLHDFKKTGFSRHGKNPDLPAIELAGEELREKYPITFEDVRKLLNIAKEHWWFAEYWDLPHNEEGSLALPFRFCDLEEENEKQAIQELLNDLKHIELASIVLRFVRPDQYGILSPPVQRILNVGWGSDAAETYVNYLYNLREIRKKIGFSRAADVDMALWVLHAKVFGGEPGGREFREYYDNDEDILKIRAENILGPFQKIPLLPLAKAMERKQSNLAAVAACYLFEIAVREKAKKVGGVYEGGVRLSDVLKDLRGRLGIEGSVLRHWKDLKQIRDNLFHRNIKPARSQIQELLKEIEEIQMSLPGIKLGERSVG